MTDPGAPAPSQRHPFLAIVATNVAVLASIAVSILFCLIIGSLFWPYIIGKDGANLLRDLSDFEVARGLITFLVAVTTVGIALILTVYVVATSDANAKDNFALGKEVLTGLIGILGTIIGFYFGASGFSANSSLAPKVASIKVEPDVSKPGGRASISMAVHGGKPPFTYVISFKPDNILGECPKCSNLSQDGAISADVAIPATVAPNASFDVVVSVKDSAGVAADISAVGATRIKIAP